VGVGIDLAWLPPGTGPVSGYRIYRGATSLSMSLFATVGDVTSFNDASAGRAAYYYRVTAFNVVGEGPASSLVAMVGKTAAARGTVGENQTPAGAYLISPNQLRNALSWRWA
jgi:hypothetical protein